MSRKVTLVHEDLRIVRAWLLLQKKLETAVLNAGLGAVLYVDAVDGNDASAQRGSIVNTYATIQAALNAAQAGDEVFIGPGVYAENVTIPNVDGLSITGSGERATIVAGSGVGSTMQLVAAAANNIRSLSISDMKITNGAGGGAFALVIDGAATDDLCDAEGGLRLKNLVLAQTGGTNDGLWINRVNYVWVYQVQVGDDQTTRRDTFLQNVGWCNLFEFWGAEFTVDYDFAAPQPSTGRGSVEWRGGEASTVNVENQAVLFAAGNSNITTLRGNLNDFDAANFGFVVVKSRIGSVLINVTATLTSGTDIYIRLDGAVVLSTCTIIDVGSAVRFRATALGAVFDHLVNPVRAGNLCDFDIRGSAYLHSALRVTGSGTIDRTTWVQSHALVGAPFPDTVVFSNGVNNIPYPAGVNYSVGLEFDTLADAPGQVANKLPASADITASGNAGNVVLTVTREDG